MLSGKSVESTRKVDDEAGEGVSMAGEFGACSM